MKEFLGYSIILTAVALHMSPKTIQHYVLKCLNTEEVKACTKVRKTKNIAHYASARGISRALLYFFPTTFLEIAVYGATC